jgi:hypothetical protein
MNYAQDFCNAFEAICNAIDSINSEFYKNRLIQFNNYLCELKKIHTEAIENKIDSKIINTFEEKIKQYETGFDDLKAQNIPLDSEINKNYLKGNFLKATKKTSERFLGGLGIFSSSKFFIWLRKLNLDIVKWHCTIPAYRDTFFPLLKACNFNRALATWH